VTIVVQNIVLSSRLFGSGYTFPETSSFRATFSMDILGPSAASGSLQYYYSRSRMNFVSTSITMMAINGSTVTISGVGTVNGTAGYTYSATVVIGSTDRFGLTIRRADGTVFYSAPLLNLSGGDLSLQ
jgi:hypothetical protein